MEHTFMTIHNLTPDANILFASDSIQDILGYLPDEVQGKSCFDYFHPDEVPFARTVHSRGVSLDKAAVLHYARILARDGQWVSCECCFTIVHDVLVACTSIYRRGEKSEIEIIRGTYASYRKSYRGTANTTPFLMFPRDPRYHMLEHLSPKFKMPPMEREPRAALILNRFTRNLNIMFATNAVSAILGLRPDEIKDKPFYHCIQDNCLADAIRCLESAKANDSIAYLRFWFRDPRVVDDYGDDIAEEAEQEDQEMMVDGEVSSSTSDSEGGGVPLNGDMAVDSDSGPAMSNVKEEPDTDYSMDNSVPGPSTSASSDSDPRRRAAAAVFDGQPVNALYQTPLTSNSSVTATHGNPHGATRRREPRGHQRALELEAVVSCTSDGLVVVLRRARPQIPAPHPPLLSPFDFENGLFAAPWAMQPIRPYYPPELIYNFRPPLLPQYMPLREGVKAAGGPPADQLMRSIRDVAVFAWALVGINGNFASYGHGLPRGDAQPDGLPIWDPHSDSTGYLGPENQAARKWAQMGENGKAPEHGALDGDFHHALDGHYAVPSYPLSDTLQGYPPAPAHAEVPVRYPTYHPPQLIPQGPAPMTLSVGGAGGFEAQHPPWPPEQHNGHPPPPPPYISTAAQQLPTPPQTHLHHHQQYEHHLHQQQPQANAAPPLAAFANLPQEPWQEAAATTQPYSAATYAVPTTQGGGSSPDNGPFGYRFEWP